MLGEQNELLFTSIRFTLGSRFAVCTGMRKGEILNLKWPDVDFRRRIITILETKSQKKREIPIGIGVSRLLLKQKKHQDSPYIFCHKDGRRIGSFRKAFGKALKKIGIKDFTFDCGGSSAGRASAFQADGRGFESRSPLHGERSSVG